MIKQMEYKTYEGDKTNEGDKTSEGDKTNKCNTQQSRPPIGDLFEVEKKNAAGEVVIDPETKKPVLQTVYRTYELGKSFMGWEKKEVVLDEDGNPEMDKKTGKVKTASKYYLDEEKVMSTFLTPGPVEWAGPNQKREVLQFACGMHHFVVVARDFGVFSPRVYSSGGNNYGQLGHGDFFERHELTPIKKLDDERISMAACGDFHSLALAMDGSNVFAWGRSDAGQLGLYEKIQIAGSFELLPKEVPFPEETMGPSRIVDISCGGTTSFALSSKGNVYSWGFNDSGATGQPSDATNDINLPKLVELNNTLVEAVAGGGQHSLLLVKRYREA